MSRAVVLVLITGQLAQVKCGQYAISTNTTGIPFSPDGEPPQFFGPCNASSSCSSRGGNIIFGGFFPMHEWYYPENRCGTIYRPEQGFQRLEAMRWAVEKYGREFDVGYDLRDTCSKDTNSRDEALDFINVGTRCRDGIDLFQQTPITMVIGASSSTVSADVTSLLTLFEVPEISYAATSDALNITQSSDQARFTNFFRVVPSDRFQVNAIIDLMERMNWTYVSVVYTDDLYGRSAYEWLKIRESVATSTNFSFCLAAEIEIRAREAGVSDGTTYTEAINELNRGWDGNATVVILFVQHYVAREILLEASRPLVSGQPGPRRIWIAPDAWSGNLPTVLPSSNISINQVVGIQPTVLRNNEFEDHLRNTRFCDFPGGIRQQYYIQYFDYLFGRGNYNNLTTAGESPLFNVDAKVSFVIRSVRLGLMAVNLTCNGLTSCIGGLARNGAVSGQMLTWALKNATFNIDGVDYTYDGTNTRSFLPTNGESYKYTILFYQGNRNVPESARFVKVGEWSSANSLKLYNTTLEDALRNNSICADPCAPGYFRSVVPDVPRPCCWRCRACGQFEYVVDGVTCQACPDDTVPNSERTGCQKLKPDFLKWGDALAVLMLVFVVISMVLTTVTVVVAAKYWATPLVRASSREHSAVLISGFILGCIVTVFFITEPSPATCAIRRFGLSFVLTLGFGALLVKTNRISRVFNRPPGQPRPSYITPEWQLLFTGTITLVQVSQCGCSKPGSLLYSSAA